MTGQSRRLHLTGSDSTPPRAAAAAAVTCGSLENGMEVVVIRDQRSPVATHMVWYRNGAVDDPAGKSGIAHFLEHLIFKGTHRYPARHFSDLLAGIGGQENAFTSWSYTCYFQRVPVEHLSTCMIYEADRMSNLAITDSQIAPERDVVLAERGMMCDSNPARLLDEALQAAAFPAHSCGRPVIGWRHEIETLGLDDAMAYYRRFYTPENAILVVAGDVEADAVMAMAQAHYGTIPASENPVPRPAERSRLQYPAREAQRRIIQADPSVGQPLLRKLYVVPSASMATWRDAAALDLLAHILARGETSLLHRQLVLDSRLATFAGANYLSHEFDEQTCFDIGLGPADGVDMETLDAALEAVLEQLRQSGVAATDLARAKTQLVAETIYSHDSHVALAEQYGITLCCGLTVEDIRLWPERIEAVDNADLIRVASYLGPENCVTGHLIPAE